MNRLFPVLAALVAVAASGCAPKVDVEADRRDSRQHSAYIKVRPPFLEFRTAEESVYVSERGLAPRPIVVKVKVDNVGWNKVRSLAGAAPNEPVFELVFTDDGALRVQFGDGLKGARLPTGTNNVTAMYRTGSGPEGNIGQHVYLSVWRPEVSAIEDPDLKEPSLTRDLGVALVELLAMFGDALSEYQDAVAKEAQLGTDRPRRSPRRYRALLTKLQREVQHLSDLLTVLDEKITNLEK